MMLRSIRLFIYITYSLSATVRRVGIIGGGVGGLGLAASLKILDSGVQEVVVFESRKEFLQSKLGGGLQVSGGACVLESLGALKALDKVAEPVIGVKSRTSKGDVLLELDIFNSIKKKASKELLSSEGKPLAYSIMRDALQKLLFDLTQQSDSPSFPTSSSYTNKNTKSNTKQSQTTVRFSPNKRCVNVLEQNNQITLSFADGSEENGFDLVVGCDGIQSVVKSCLETRGRISTPSQPLKTTSNDSYSGIRITYCVTDPDPKFRKRLDSMSSASCRGMFHQWFGDGLYVLCASYGGLQGIQHMLAVVYSEKSDAVEGENVSWRSGKENMKDSLKNRLIKAGFSAEQNSEVWGLLEASSPSRIFDLGVRDRLLPLDRWSSLSGRIILLGDSAHAMAPFLGQGANQALQDAFSLAQGISRVQSETILDRGSDNSLSNMAKKYESTRKKPTALLSLKSGFLGKVETLSGPTGVLFRDNFFRFTGCTGIAEYVYLDGAKPVF